jgi:hypothetical protein
MLAVAPAFQLTYTAFPRNCRMERDMEALINCLDVAGSLLPRNGMMPSRSTEYIELSLCPIARGHDR